MDVLKRIEAFGISNKLKATECGERAEKIRRQIDELPSHYSADLVPGEAKRLRAQADRLEKDAVRYRRQASYNEQSLILLDQDTLNNADFMSTDWYHQAQSMGLCRYTDESAPDPQSYD